MPTLDTPAYLRMDKALKNRADQYAEDHRTSFAAVVREALLQYLDRQTPTPPAKQPTYAERRPVTLPDNLNQLAGPTTGTLTLPHRLNWSGSGRTYNLETPADLTSAYTTVLSEAMHADDLTTFINPNRLAETWDDLPLPPKVRRLWEQRFPELATPHVRAEA